MTSIKNAFADGASIMRESIQRAKQFDKLGEDEFIKVKAKLMCASFNVVLFAALLAAFRNPIDLSDRFLQRCTAELAEYREQHMAHPARHGN